MVAAVPAGSCSQEAPVLLPGPLHDSSNTTINEYEKQQLQLGKAGKARQSQVRTVIPDLNALHCRNQPREQQRSHGGVEQEPRRRAARLPVAKENAKHQPVNQVLKSLRVLRHLSTRQTVSELARTLIVA
jgi:hypothetical protein